MLARRHEHLSVRTVPPDGASRVSWTTPLTETTLSV